MHAGKACLVSRSMKYRFYSSLNESSCLWQDRRSALWYMGVPGGGGAVVLGCTLFYTVLLAVMLYSAKKKVLFY